MALFWLLLYSTLLSADITLHDRLPSAQVGDYAVIHQGRLYTFFHIISKKGETLGVEEISIPQPIARDTIHSWVAWRQEQAPFNSSWVLYQINIPSGNIENFYSFTQKTWCTVSEEESFLHTLLKLALTPKDSTSTPPPMIVQGKPIQGASLQAYTTRWPRDNSPLSDRQLDLYLPSSPPTSTAPYPSYLPYWVQIEGFAGRAKLRIVDSGSTVQK